MKHRSKTTTRKIHSLIATFTLVAMGGAGILSVPSVSAADSCDDKGYDMECSFTCLKGETLFVSGNGDRDGYGWVNAQCEGASADCGLHGTGSCSERGFTTADDAGTGKCLGNSGGGRGNMLCGSGSGDGELLLDLLDGLLKGGASCPAYAMHLEESAIRSLVVLTSDGDTVTRLFAWGADTGCQ